MTRFPRCLFAAISGVLFLVGCSSPQPSQGNPSSDISVSPDAGPITLAEGSQALEAGTYVLDLGAGGSGTDHFPDIGITVPEGWTNIDGWGVGSGAAGDHPMAITFWEVDEVNAHPCRSKGSRMIQPDPTVADLAKALAKQPLRDATEPVAVVVDGYHGMQLEWSVPADIDFSKCEDGFFESWTSSAGSWNTDRYQQGPGQVDRLWILDVDGERLVVDGWFMPTTDAKDREELWQVMESIRFEK